MSHGTSASRYLRPRVFLPRYLVRLGKETQMRGAYGIALAILLAIVSLIVTAGTVAAETSWT